MHSVDDLRRLSALLDEALDLPESSRAAWLHGLQGDAARLVPALSAMLARSGLQETADLLERGPSFTAFGGQVAKDGLGAGDTVGPYRLVRELGRGGMGVVWLAERTDGQLKRAVALKLPMLGMHRSMLVERFARERDILGGLVHPHIARLYDAGITADGQPYMALEYVQGTSLLAYCDGKGLGTAQRLALAMQVLDAVQYAHSRLVIHRDLKPGNIFVTADGQVRLLDFGVAKLITDDEGQQNSQLTEMAGQAFTPDYASPEQVRGDNLGTASDVYSLGVVLYELLCGGRPYRLRRSTAAQLEEAILEADPPLPSTLVDEAAARSRGATVGELQRQLRGDIDTIVLKALKKRPEDRYGTVAELVEDLARHREGRPVLARPDSFTYVARKYVLRNKLVAGSGAAVVLALSLGLGVALWQYWLAVEQARVAREEAQTSKAVQGFMEDIFRANSTANPDPQKARRTTAEELLDIAGKKAATAMTDAPAARLKMLGVLADMYAEMGLYDKSETMARLGVDAAFRPGAASEELLDALERYDGALSASVKLDEAEAVAQRRQALATKLHLDDPRRLGAIELTLGGLALQRRPNSALPHIERAIELLRRTRDDESLAEALFYKANLLNLLSDPAGARAAALAAQAVLDRLKGTRATGNSTRLQANVFQELSGSAKQLGELDQAVHYARLSVQTALSLHEHEGQSARLKTGYLILALVAASRPLEALRYADETWHLSDPAVAEIDSNAQFRLLRAYAHAQGAAGRLEDASTTIDRALSLARRARTQPGFVAYAMIAKAYLTLRLGRFDAAEAEWNAGFDGLPAPRSQGIGEAFLASLRIAQGRGADARPHAQAWLQSPQRPAGIRDDSSADCLLAEAEVVDGHWGQADQVVSKALQRIEGFGQREALADLEARALWIRGRARLGRKDADSALQDLQRAVTLLERVVDTRVSLNLASTLGSLAQAQFRTGHAAQARETFLRMKTIHAQHPNLGSPVQAELAAVGREVSVAR